MLERLKFAPSADLCQHLLSVSYHDRLAVGGAVDYPHRLCHILPAVQSVS